MDRRLDFILAFNLLSYKSFSLLVNREIILVNSAVAGRNGKNLSRRGKNSGRSLN